MSTSTVIWDETESQMWVRYCSSPWTPNRKRIVSRLSVSLRVMVKDAAVPSATVVAEAVSVILGATSLSSTVTEAEDSPSDS